MGYYIRKGLVDENAVTLDMIHDAVIGQKKALRFSIQTPDDMSKLKYQFNRLLRATQILKDEGGGRFINLRSITEVRENWKDMCLEVRPKTGSAALTNIEPELPDESHWLEGLRTCSGAIYGITYFMPSPRFDFERIQAQARSLGWTCIGKDGLPMLTDMPEENDQGEPLKGYRPGMKQLIATRSKKDDGGAFGFLGKLKGGPAD